MKKVLFISLLLASTTVCYAGLDFSTMILEDRDVNQQGVYREQRMLKTEDEVIREANRDLNTTVNNNVSKKYENSRKWRHPYKNSVKGLHSMSD